MPRVVPSRLHYEIPHAMPIIKIFILACLIGIVVSLGSGMYHLMTDKGDSKKMVKALTVRVALSVGLFVLLLIAWSQGLIEPHGISR
jgi:succinate dehydrogenase/fumarate reductase cytochrome b subunit